VTLFLVADCLKPCDQIFWCGINLLEDRVYFHDDMGNLKRMPAGWTSAAPPNAFEKVSAGRSHFRIEDLLQLTMLIARYRETNGHSKGHAGKRKPSRK